MPCRPGAAATAPRGPGSASAPTQRCPAGCCGCGCAPPAASSAAQGSGCAQSSGCYQCSCSHSGCGCWRCSTHGPLAAAAAAVALAAAAAGQGDGRRPPAEEASPAGRAAASRMGHAGARDPSQAAASRAAGGAGTSRRGPWEGPFPAAPTASGAAAPVPTWGDLAGVHATPVEAAVSVVVPRSRGSHVQACRHPRRSRRPRR
mmetsp:Transcript_73227/g.228415  ORF Transcript_73227/g.228415 Transcript_73227/m.228415 type:complete len:203 (+) Transcript_73227:343-951(+)